VYAITPPVASPSPLPDCELLQLSGESQKYPIPSPQLAGDIPPRSLDNFQQGQIPVKRSYPEGNRPKRHFILHLCYTSILIGAPQEVPSWQMPIFLKISTLSVPIGISTPKLPDTVKLSAFSGCLN